MKKYLTTNWGIAVCAATGFGLGRLAGEAKPIEALVNTVIIYLLFVIIAGMIKKDD